MADVKVPFEFLSEVEELISYIDLEKFDYPTQLRFNNVLYDIKLKKKKLENREVFKKMKSATGETKDDLIIDYLKNKHDIKGGEIDG